VPGFVDLHIHGGFGVDFMTATPDEMVYLCARLAEEGYEAWLPTTITASLPDVLQALAHLPRHSMIPGFHLEGPFISPDYPGAQPPDAILSPDLAVAGWDEVWTHPLLRLVTLAPERPGALDLIRRLSARGVRASMGHTAASFAQATAGVEAGVCHATHTYNAMKGLHHREAGALGCALSDDRVLAELIYDRVHVSPAAASVLLKAKGLKRVAAVSDSTMASGMAPGTEFEVWGHTMITAEGEVRLKSNGALAGSAITLRQAFRNLGQDFGIEAAVMACSVNPRRALGMGSPARVWLWIDPDFCVAAILPC
jgi:N-acetylglucosamine-6-phosphate deacetylase